LIIAREACCFRSVGVLFSFADQTLDVDRRELRGGSGLVPVEPQVFHVLIFLIRNRDRVVSKDDLIASVWGGRVVSDSTLTSRINAARRAVGDSGEEQRLIRTVSRKGFRFVAKVAESEEVPPPVKTSGALDPSAARQVEPGIAARTLTGAAVQDAVTSARRASIAVMPFADRSDVLSVRGGAADALAHDVITRLAKLRSLFVIAQGTVFALHERGIGPEDAGRTLQVDYVASGSVRRSGKRLIVEFELAKPAPAESFGRTASTVRWTMPFSSSTRSATASSHRSRARSRPSNVTEPS
jgi:DNA-binding winged helix-turn-helix (wHTH) protein